MDEAISAKQVIVDSVEEVTVPAKEEIKNGTQNGDEHIAKTEEEKPDEETDTSSATDEIAKKISQQMEYYFGNYNLPRDKFLKEEILKDDGWITMTTLLNFQRLAALSTDVETILKAVESSKIIEIDESRLKVRRSVNNPIPMVEGDLRAESVNRTMYVKGFPKDGSITLDVLLEFFKEHGPVETIHMRNFHDRIKKTSGFKGSILVVFPSRAEAEAFLQKFDLKYHKTPLLRMWFEDYVQEKKKEFEERVQRKEEYLKSKQTEKEDIDKTLPKGAYLHISNIPAGVRREDIKASLIEYTTDFAFIGFKQDEVEGYIRFKTEGCNVHMLSLLQGKLKINETEITVRLVEGEEEEEQLKRAAEAFINSRNMNSRSSRPHKRNFRGGRGSYRGPSNKRRRYHPCENLNNRQNTTSIIHYKSSNQTDEIKSMNGGDISANEDETSGCNAPSVHVYGFPNGRGCDDEDRKEWSPSIHLFSPKDTSLPEKKSIGRRIANLFLRIFCRRKYVVNMISK